MINLPLLQQLNEMSMTDMRVTVRLINKMYLKYEIEVNPTIHVVYDRLKNGERDADVTIVELVSTFKTVLERDLPAIEMAKKNGTEYLALVRDYRSNLNVVFSIHFEWGKRPASESVAPIMKETYKMNVITVMRKNPDGFKNDNFKTDHNIIIRSNEPATQNLPVNNTPIIRTKQRKVFQPQS